MSFRHVAACFLSLAVGALSQGLERPIPYPIPRGAAWQRAVDAGTRTDVGAPGANYWTNWAHYKIDAEIEPATALVTGRVDVTYENRSPKRVRNLMVHLRQNLHRAEAVRNTPVEITGGMTVSGAKVTKVGDAGEAVEIKSDPTGTVWSVRVPGGIEPGKSIRFECAFSFAVPRAGRAPRMGHENNRVFFLGYWYPQVAVLEDVEDWVAEPYMGAGEFYMGYGDYELAITAPHGWIVQATGALLNADEVLPEALSAKLAAARASRDIVRLVTKEELGKPGAATRESANGKLTWRFKAESVRDVAVATSNNYLWDVTGAAVVDKAGPGQDGTCLIHALYEPNARGWDKAAEYTRHTVEFMSKLVHPYPWDHMTACEGIVGGGMEFPMMTDVGPTGVAQAIQEVICHETVHMWFPMIVGTNETAWAWLDEGVDTFFTSVTCADYYKNRRPIERAIRGYVTSARTEELPPMHHSDQFPAGRNGYGMSAYTKPGAVFHQLRFLVGEEKFHQAFRTYVQEWAYKHPYPQDLFNTFERVTGQDLDWYFRSWLYETWLLDQKVSSVTAGEGKTEVVIEDVGDAPHPSVVKVDYADGTTETQTVAVGHWLTGKRKASLTFKADVVKVEIDPGKETLDVDTRNNVWKTP